MTKVLKVIKQNIFGFVLGAIIFGGIGVYATAILASQVIYTNNNQENVQGAIDNLFNLTGCTNTRFSVGDYVRMVPSLNSYTTDPNYTGASAQTINPSELNLWRVIRINKDCTVDMVSEYISSTSVNFKGKTGIKNFVGYLNILAKQYENNKYTIASRHTGYNGQTEFITDETALQKTTSPWSRTTRQGVTVESQGGGDDWYLEDMKLIADACGGVVTFKAGTSTHNGYYIASRFYYVTGPTGYRYSGRLVYTNSTFGYNGAASSSSMYSYENGFKEYTETACLRPIVTLKAGLIPISGDGKSEITAWTFE